MMEVLERLGVHIPSLLIYILNFLLLWGVLYLVAFRPFQRLLRQRDLAEQRRRADEEKARKLHQEAAEAREQALAEAQKKQEALFRAAEELRNSILKEGTEQGRAAARMHLERAQEQVRLESARAYEALYESFVDLVLAASERALGRALDKEEHRKLVAEAAYELSVVESALPSGASAGLAVVTSAVTLGQEEQAQISECLAQLAGKPIRTVYLVDPSAVGGISVRTGDALLDATIHGRLERLRRHLLAQQ